MRAVAAVIVPWVVWGLLDTAVYMGMLNAMPESFGANGAPLTLSILVLFLVLRAVYSTIAGWLAARIAGTREGAIRAAVVLLVVTGIVAQIVNRGMYPIWYHVVFLASIFPCVQYGVSLGKRIKA